MSDRINFRLSSEERQTLEAEALVNAQSLSAWIRHRLGLSDVREPVRASVEKEVAEVVQEQQKAQESSQVHIEASKEFKRYVAIYMATEPNEEKAKALARKRLGMSE